MFSKLKDWLRGYPVFGAQARSSKWRKVRHAHLLKNPFCAVCGGEKKLEVHHIVMFNQDPSRELDPTNLLTLCESKKNGVTCHQFFGHLGNYSRINPDVVKDANMWYNKLKGRQ